jgi:hypothetical protein
MERFNKIETARMVAKQYEARGYETHINKEMRNRKPTWVVTVRRVA